MTLTTLVDFLFFKIRNKPDSAMRKRWSQKTPQAQPKQAATGLGR